MPHLNTLSLAQIETAESRKQGKTDGYTEKLVGRNGAAEAGGLAPLPLPLRQASKSHKAVAEQLNRAGVKTRTGWAFYAVKVGRLLAELGPMA